MNTSFMSLLDSSFLNTILTTISSATDDIRAAQKIFLDASQSSSDILLEEISRFLKTEEFLQNVNLPKRTRERIKHSIIFSPSMGGGTSGSIFQVFLQIPKYTVKLMCYPNQKWLCYSNKLWSTILIKCLMINV